MSVEIDPAELHFKRPFTREVAQTLRLTNPHSEPLAFKVKTTAPKQYCVRPNSGRIEPGGAVEVQVLLQAMKEDPPPDAKCRDKFLVQSAVVPADSLSNNWAHIEQTNKASIQERKIRVAFLPADASTPAPKANGVGHTIDTSSAAASPTSPEAVTPHHSALENKSPADWTSSSRGPVNESPATVAGIALPHSVDDVQAQLAQAQAKIAQLTKAASEQTELRRRKGAEILEQKGFPNAAQALANPQSAGVPLKWAALLVFFAFLVGWLAF